MCSRRMLVQRGAVEDSTAASQRVLARPGRQTRAPASGYTGATCPLERDAEARTTPQLKWAVREGIDMNDPSVEVSSQDTSQTSADHGRAENRIVRRVTSSSRDRDHPWNFGIGHLRQGRPEGTMRR